MFITLPLALIGVGYLVYLLFGAASYALPLCAGLSAGFTAAHAGASGTAALLLGIAVFMAVIAAGRMATLLLPSRYARLAVMLLFAIPAVVAAYPAALALMHLGGVGGWCIAAAGVVALATGFVAARRYAVPRG